MFQVINGVRVWGEPDLKAVEQMATCISTGDVAAAALMADHHFGYSQPIGGVVAYRGMVSPSGVGYDIACGNKAVRTNLTYGDIKNDLSRIADEVAAQVQFGIGKITLAADKGDHALFDDDRWNLMPQVANLKELARNQLGTVGSGNHYVDIFVELEPLGDMLPGNDVWTDEAPVWIGVHFGSRGFGHKTATGFMNLARNIEFDGRAAKGEAREDEAVLISLDSDLGQAYNTIMNLAGDYAYAGRDYVVEQVLGILGTTANLSVHNHHNFAWEENHAGEKVWVVRKGATPLWPGQMSFIGGSMCDPAVIVRGRGMDYADVAEQQAALYSTVHGAGRVMGRMEAKGKIAKDGTVKRVGKVSTEDFNQIVADYGIHLRGADVDESPFVYRRLKDVLAAHSETLDIMHNLRPIIVAMAGEDVRDPYKD